MERSTTADRPDISIRGTHGLSYTDAALAVDDMLFPAGEALRAVHAEEPRITLFAADRFHPSRAGTYLAALVVIGALTGRSTEGLSHAPPVVEI